MDKSVVHTYYTSKKILIVQNRGTILQDNGPPESTSALRKLHIILLRYHPHPQPALIYGEEVNIGSHISDTMNIEITRKILTNGKEKKRVSYTYRHKIRWGYSNNQLVGASSHVVAFHMASLEQQASLLKFPEYNSQVRRSCSK